MWSMKNLPLRHEVHFGARVVRCFADRPSSVTEMFTAAVACNGSGEALVCGAERLTWSDLHARVMRCAGGLSKLQVRHGDRVALLLGNGTEFVVALLAIAAVGGIAVPMSTRDQAPGIQYILGHCMARVLIHDAELTDRLPAGGDAPALLYRVTVGGAAESTLSFATLLEAPPLRVPVPLVEEDAAAILYTSGTTGRPKGAVLTHLGIVHSAMHYEAAMGLGPQDRCAAVVPLNHVTGVVAMVMAMVRCAGTLVVAAAFKAKDFLELAARERITYTLMVPAMYNLCLLQPDLDDHDLSAWRVGAYGGAPMPPATIDALSARVPSVTLMNVYGATETTSPATVMPPGQTGLRGASVGLPVACADVLVMDDAGLEVPRGATGEIWIAGPMVVKEYWNDPAATSQNITGGFWHTGDIGRVDEDGYVYVSDRKKDMLNRGGLKIYSVEVENVLAEHPSVVEAAVVGKPCPVLGERVHAFVYAPNNSASAEALRELCAQRLSDYKIPESFTLLSEPLPRNANGKVLKRDLRERLLAQDEVATRGGR